MRNRSWFGWLGVILGLLLVVLGILALALPGLALTGLVFAYGIAAVGMGVMDILLYIRIERCTGWAAGLSLAAGVLSVMAGLVLLAFPATGIVVLTVLFPLWFLAHCVARLVHWGRVHRLVGHGVGVLTLVIHLLGLVLGVLMLLSPLLTLTTLRCLAAGYLILLGVDSLVMAWTRLGDGR